MLQGFQCFCTRMAEIVSRFGAVSLMLASPG